VGGASRKKELIKANPSESNRNGGRFAGVLAAATGLRWVKSWGLNEERRKEGRWEGSGGEANPTESDHSEGISRDLTQRRGGAEAAEEEACTRIKMLARRAQRTPRKRWDARSRSE